MASRRVRVLLASLIGLAIVLAVGVWLDLLSGLPLFRHTRSWGAWIAGALALGGLYLLGEMGSEWINARDRVTDPLPRRLGHLLALLALVAALLLVGFGLMRVVS